jgi:hypothetical protein
VTASYPSAKASTLRRWRLRETLPRLAAITELTQPRLQPALTIVGQRPWEPTVLVPEKPEQMGSDRLGTVTLGQIRA